MLLLLPLFQEFDILGIKLKKEVADLKSEMNEQIFSIRSEMHSIGVNTNVSPQVLIYPPPDHELPDIEKRVKNAVHEAMKNLRIESPVDIQSETVLPHDTNYLFAIRYTMEREVRRIWARRLQEERNRRPLPVSQIAQILADMGVIEPRLASAIREVYAICSPAVHGEDVSENQLAFAKDVGPELIATLKAIK